MNKLKLIMLLLTRLLCIVLVMSFSTKSYATNLGVVGQIYPILEEDFLLFIQNKIKTMQSNGEWNKLQNDFRNRVSEHANRPRAISLISHTMQAKNWMFDPSITIPYDLNDAEGRLIARAGTTVNPLKFITLHKVLLFLDGDDPKQITWAKNMEAIFHGKTKLILVNGSIVENEKIFSKPIYFDQEGQLVRRFDIHHVPALVQQEGFYLKISEVVP